MKLLLLRVAGLIVLAAVVVIGGVSFDSSSSSTTVDAMQITGYQATYDVGADGLLTATETYQVDFAAPRHGLFRLFDERFQGYPKHRLIPTDIHVRRDGQDEPFTIVTEQRGRFHTVKVGSADTTLTGPHTYTIDYRIKGVLVPGTSTPTQFYWNLVGQAATVPIQKTAVNVHLPVATAVPVCRYGTAQDSKPCTVRGSGTPDLTITTGSIPPTGTVTLAAPLDMATPDGNTLPWDSTLDAVLGQRPVVLGLTIAVAIAAAIGGLILSGSAREKDPQFPLMYAPPDGIGPAQAAYILTEDLDRKAFVATMMYAGEKGAVQLDQSGDQWTVAGAGDGSAWTGVDDVTRLAGQALGVAGSGTSFTASPRSASAGETLKSALSGFESDVKVWSRTAGLMRKSGLGSAGFLVLLVAWGLTVYLGAFNPFNMSIVALIPGLFAIGAVGVGLTGAGTKRTAAGRELWSRIGGFRRILETPSAQDRFDFASRKDLYTQYLPWAVAFDCADAWAKKYRVETGQEPPVPSYFPVYAGVHTGNFVNQMVGSFDSAVSSAISSYQATQSSSSSGGGGGFSVGGGGGGGGVGSW